MVQKLSQIITNHPIWQHSLYSNSYKILHKLIMRHIFFVLCLILIPFFRKACIACGCSTVDHAPGSDVEDDQRMGRLLADSPCSHLTAKVKGGGGLRMYKRNRMIVTNPVVSRKDPTFNTTTYDWAPAGLNQTLVRISVKYRRLVVRTKLKPVGLRQLVKSHLKTG